MNEPLRATLALLEKLTLTPSAVGPEDIAPVRAAGVSNRAIEDAIVVCALFNIIDRLADAFEVEIPSEEGFARTGARLFAMGYL
jgi:alkylhydroperoxidase family enzyme